MISSVGFRTAIVLVAALVLQVCLLGRLPVFGVTADLMLLVAIAAGLASGPERGAIVGFAAGLLIDVTLNTPLGLSALVFAVVGYGVGGLQHAVLGATWYTPVVVTAAASMAGTVVYAAFGLLVGKTEWLEPRLAVVALVVGVLNGLLSPLPLRFVRWTEGQPLGVRLPSLRRSHQPFRRGRRPRSTGWGVPAGLSMPKSRRQKRPAKRPPPPSAPPRYLSATAR